MSLRSFAFIVVNISVVLCFDLKKVPDEPFIPLTKEDKAEVYNAFSGKNRYGLSCKEVFIACLCVLCCI